MCTILHPDFFSYGVAGCPVPSMEIKVGTDGGSFSYDLANDLPLLFSSRTSRTRGTSRPTSFLRARSGFVVPVRDMCEWKASHPLSLTSFPCAFRRYQGLLYAR
jgi:hypothetical protein